MPITRSAASRTPSSRSSISSSRSATNSPSSSVKSTETISTTPTTSPPSSPKRSRNDSELYERPAKQLKISLERTNRLGKIDPFAQPTPKTSSSINTSNDQSKYARRAESKENPWSRRRISSRKKIRSDWTRMPSSNQKGMVNHAGNLCYRLSLLQALLHLPVFVNWVVDNVKESNCAADNHDKCLSCALRNLVVGYWGGSRQMRNLLVELDKRLDHLGWEADSANGHGDPDEQYNFISKILRNELPSSIFTLFETITQTFTDSTVQCRKCGYKSKRTDNADKGFSLPLMPRVNKGSLPLYLAKYMDEICEDYKCDKCHQKSNAHRSQKISFSPEILTIQLKRFDWEGKKDKAPVKIDPILDLNDYRSEKNLLGSRYELTAVVKHSGSSGGGHYVCHAKGPDGAWKLYDDSSKLRSDDKAATDNNGFTPYILFYQRLKEVRKSSRKSN